MSSDSLDLEALLQRALVAEQACAIRDAVFREIQEYLDREQHRAHVAKTALRTSPDAEDAPAAVARLHEVIGVAGVLKRLIAKPAMTSAGRGWVSPKEARQVHEALLGCFQQLLNPNVIVNPRDFGLYRNALALLAARLGLPET